MNFYLLLINRPCHFSDKNIRSVLTQSRYESMKEMKEKFWVKDKEFIILKVKRTL